MAKPIVGMDALSSGQGYRFVASDGGVLDFGAAGFLGSMGGHSLPAPVVGMAAARMEMGIGWSVAVGRFVRIKAVNNHNAHG